VLNAHCWAKHGHLSKGKLAAEGVTLAAGLIRQLLWYVDVYAPQGKIGFTITQNRRAGLLVTWLGRERN